MNIDDFFGLCLDCDDEAATVEMECGHKVCEGCASRREDFNGETRAEDT